MKLSEALTDPRVEVRGLENSGLHHCGFRGDLNDHPAVAKWLRAHPEFDSEVRLDAVPLAQREIRPEQSEFRNLLLRAYEGKCAVTNESCSVVLEAAHLPGRSHREGRNRARHGILLRADLHKLMDAKPPLLSLEPRGRDIVVRVDPAAGADYAQFNGKKIRLPKGIYDRPAL